MTRTNVGTQQQRAPPGLGIKRRSWRGSALTTLAAMVVSLVAPIAAATPAHATPVIAFRSETSGRWASPFTLVTVSEPAGTSAGDILVCYIVNDTGTMGVVTPPLGWSLLGGAGLGSGAGSGLVMQSFWIQRGATAPGLTFRATLALGWHCQAYSGALGGSLTAGSGTKTTSSTTISFSSITTTINGSLYVADMTYGAVNAVTTAPSGTTLRAKQALIPNSQTADVTIATAGTVAAKTATLSTAADNLGFPFVISPPPGSLVVALASRTAGLLVRSALRVAGLVSRLAGLLLPPLPPIIGLPSSKCSHLLNLGTVEGVYYKLFYLLPRSNEVQVCLRAVLPSGVGYGGLVDITGPGVVGGGVPLVTPVNLAPPGPPDSNATACSTTAGNQVPGLHPMVRERVNGQPVTIDTYLSSYRALAGGVAMACLGVGGGGYREVINLPGVTVRGGGLPIVTPPTVFFYPDRGTPPGTPIP